MIQVYSEIGKLNKVMLHRPCNELYQINPFNLEEMLFEDTPYLKDAQFEHDSFSKILKDNGVEVVYLKDLFYQAMMREDVRRSFILDFTELSNISSIRLKEKVKNHYTNLDLNDFIDSVFEGLRRDNPYFKKKDSLGEMTYLDDIFIVNPMPNCYFTRDSSVNIADSVIISNMGKQFRRREPLLLKYIHQYSDEFKDNPTINLFDNTLPYGIEGGDIIILSDKVVCIGCTERTSPGAIEYVSMKLFEKGYEAIYAFELERGRNAMHLDGMLTMIDYETFIFNPFLSGSVNVFKISPGREKSIKVISVTDSWEKVLADALNTNAVKLIPCGNGDRIIGNWELWNLGSNVLTIKPGEVVGYDRNDVTLSLLDKEGIKVHTFSGSELSRGRGGARCMSMPMIREKI
ncbi:arginine deiminase [Dethiosulfatibacter aminovorans DSM 17477]|uniref:arginine deiminase n=2 Tax=Dethiosulfatibacter TaxID=448125 RepID=A0A1M6MJF6_9FIRM|nr:arginine deiminase [Dethiosulfatibacter aminovorans DSM 17477]